MAAVASTLPPKLASVFINDDESVLHHDYEVWLEELVPHAPIDQAGPEAGCKTALAKRPVLKDGTGSPTRT
jgi:hypothetical protein